MFDEKLYKVLHSVPKPFWKPIPLKEWLKGDEYQFGQSLPSYAFMEVFFNRMPIRIAYQKRNWIFAPFDGVVVHAGKYDPNKDVLDVKGRGYTINQVLETEMECDCWVVGVFLTAFSVHLVRSPVTGVVKRVESLPPIVTANMYMDLAEMGLLVDKKVYPERFDFAYKNQREIVEIYDPYNKIDVIIVSVADRNVDNILNYRREGDLTRIGQRLQFVTWGSYGLLVIPENERKLNLNVVVSPMDYVYGGLTCVFEIN